MERKSEISFSSVVFCLLVMFIHIASQPISVLNRESFSFLAVMVPWRLSAFVVQGFLFLSALKFFLAPPITNYRHFYWRRFTTIVLPYVLWTVIYYFFFYFAGYYSLSLRDFLGYLLLGNIVSPFYFIIIIVQFYLLMPLWQKLFRSVPSALLLVVAFIITVVFPQVLPGLLAKIGITLSYTDRMFPTYLLYWVLGGVVALHYPAICRFLKQRAFLILGLWLLAAAADLFFTYQQYVFGWYFRYLETLHIFYCILSILSVFTTGLYFTAKKWLFRFDRMTFLAFLSHCLFLNIINFTMQFFGITDIGVSFIIRFFFVYAATFIFCYVVQALRQALRQKGVN